MLTALSSLRVLNIIVVSCRFVDSYLPLTSYSFRRNNEKGCGFTADTHSHTFIHLASCNCHFWIPVLCDFYCFFFFLKFQKILWVRKEDNPTVKCNPTKQSVLIGHVKTHSWDVFVILLVVVICSPKCFVPRLKTQIRQSFPLKGGRQENLLWVSVVFPMYCLLIRLAFMHDMCFPDIRYYQKIKYHLFKLVQFLEVSEIHFCKNKLQRGREQWLSQNHILKTLFLAQSGGMKGGVNQSTPPLVSSAGLWCQRS